MRIRVLSVVICLVLLTLWGYPASYAQGNSTPTPFNLNATPQATGKVISSIRVFGRVTNGTSGAKLPDVLKLTLTVTGLDESDLMSSSPKQIAVRDTDMAVDGTYSFDNVPGQLGYTYAITARYAGGFQTSRSVNLTNARTELEVPLTIYEASTDPSIVRATRLMVSLDFAAIPGFVQLSWIYEFSVTGDRLFLTPSRTAQGDPISVVLPLPTAAQNVSFGGEKTNRRFVIDVSSIQDTLPILPGEKHLISFNYRLAYQNSLIYSEKMPYSASDIQILIPALDERIKLTGDGFSAGEPFTTQVGTGIDDTYTLYKHVGTISPNQLLTFTINGTPHQSSIPAEQASTPNAIPYLLLGGGILFLVIAGAVLLMRRNKYISQKNSTR